MWAKHQIKKRNELMKLQCITTAPPKDTVANDEKQTEVNRQGSDNLSNYIELKEALLFQLLTPKETKNKEVENEGGEKPSSPSSEALPELKAWMARDAKLSWQYKKSVAAEGNTAGTAAGFQVRGFNRVLKCAAFVKPEQLVEKQGILTRLANFVTGTKPRAPPSGADTSNLIG